MSDSQVSREDRREAGIVSKHLPEGYSAAPHVVTGDQNDAVGVSTAQEQDSLTLQGGDIHRDIFKIQARAKGPKRAATFSQPSLQRSNTFNPNQNDGPGNEHRAPGGFRRQFLERSGRSLSSVATPVTKNFVSFLDLYGSFAGEDLGESEDESAVGDVEEAEAQQEASETRPLLGRRKSSRRTTKPGDAGTTKTFFTLLKAFVGTGIMFLPKAFRNGGILFSSITLIVISLVSCLCFHLLLECRKQYGGGYGEIGGRVGGPKLRKLILASIALSQIGFVCAGIIFTAENLYSFVEAVRSADSGPMSTNALIALQLVVLIPLALVRNISKLGPAALLADVFIFIGLIYIWYYDISALAKHGIHPTVELFNKDFTLTVGSAIFTFEGIGLILPIQSSMKQPEKFSKLLYIVMFFITIVFTSIGALCYATFGDDTDVEIISNFPQSSKIVNAVQFLYSLAVLVGTPVQEFPAVRIIETSLFGEHVSGKRSTATKWKKNFLRVGLTVFCALIAILGANDLDKFVALIGSVACVPLVYIYPAWLHYKGIAESRWAKGADATLMIIGLAAMVYTSVITISNWASS